MHISDEDVFERNWLWLGIDQKGCIAAFQSLGEGVLPPSVRKSMAEAEAIDEYIDTQLRLDIGYCIAKTSEEAEKYAMIEAQQMPWRQSRTLDAEIGEYVVMMRESREGVFLIGAATNEEARTIEVPLDFLGEGKYKAVVLEDAPDANYLNNREAYQVRKLDVTAGDKLTLKLAPGGGAAVRIKKAE